jgi:Zn-dependent metalloprotease
VKILMQGVCLAVVGAGLAAVPATVGGLASASPAPSSVASGHGLASQLRDEAQGSVSIRNSAATESATFVRASGTNADLLPDVAGNSAAKASTKADAFVSSYGKLMGAAPGELVRQGVSSDAVGWTVSYAQVYKGVPVFGSMVKANLDKAGDLTSVNGFAAPHINVSTTPQFSASEIGKRAVAFVKVDPPTSSDGKKADTSGLQTDDAHLVVYRTGFVKGDDGKSVLAWAVKVTNPSVNDQFIFDATTGKILNRYSLTADDLQRELDEATGTAQNPIITKVWEEGDPFPDGLNQDQQNLIVSSGESYWFFKNLFGRDSYDAAGAKRITVNNDPRINCPNANWNGVTTNYCNGVTADDVVAHEWGHAYTQFTDGLIYQFQSGALNESYSDVWGETLDLINGREDEGEGNLTTKRPDNECDPTAPPKLQMSITAPANVAGPCNSAVATGFSQPFTTTAVNAQVVVATDAADPAGPTTTDGCTTPFTNTAAVAGNWAFVDRGTCSFQIKINNAVTAGAAGIVIGNNAIGVPPNVAGTAPAGFYGVAVTQADGTRFKTAGTSQVTVQAEDISTRTPSTRWLIGEKASAFSGAIRDMWTPTCHGNPGKVTDAEYNCDPLLTDAGGVHGNSGVANHAYALAVDGGSYNGQTITGLGLDKAANIWWKAQTSFLTPSSNFTDMADALHASCAALTGVTTLKSLTSTTTKDVDTSPNAAPITAANCAELDKVITAVQLRTPVTQCGFKPLLDKNTPSLCGAGYTTDTVYKEDFEDGLAGWTPTQELAVFGGTPVGGHGSPWQATTTAPGNHPGGVAYGPAPVEGTCDGSANDFSSRDSIAGPTIEVPNGTLRNLRLSFDHYVATEGTVDGGNVKMSLNGGAFTQIPTAAYVFNKPNAKLLTVAQGNTNPMQSQDAFTGTDGGESRGSWGTSQVDLTAAGVHPGDTVKLRFDVGRDGCGGVDGWYVDNIQMTVCKAISTITATHTPEPVTQGTESQVKVSVRRGDDTVGPNPTGTVVLRDQGGANVGEQQLNSDGDATFTLPGTIAVGAHVYKAEYKGDGSVAPNSTNVTVTVTAKPASPTTTTASAPQKVKQKKSFDVSVTVASAGGTPSGTVEIYDGATKIGTGTLSGGTVTIHITNGLKKKGKHTLTVKYLGTASFLASQTTVKVKVQQKKH